MGRILACILFGGFLIGTVWLAPGVIGQEVEAEQKHKSAEFVRLYERLKQTQDPEEKIRLGERLLALEPALKQWPLQNAREGVRGVLWLVLGHAYLSRTGGDRADNLEKAIAAYEAAHTVFTREFIPREWAQVQNSLGIVYLDRIHGDRADNLEKALAAFDAALAVRTREALPREWAETQNNLAIAYWNRIRGDRAENLEKAIVTFEAALTVRTREALAQEWATVQHNLGLAYRHRIRGDRANNLEKAIETLEAALTVFTREALPYERAAAQTNLGLAYVDRIRGERADNLERAIAALEAALTVRTRGAVPREWAATQHNLAGAYQNRIRGDRAENLEKAIAAYQAALTVTTRDAVPREWAQTQSDLAVAYEKRIRGDRTDNLEKAIAANEAALTVTTREAFPREWATTQNNLGIAYQDRIHGDRAENLDEARKAFEATLTVFTREAFPREWARTQNNLGVAYRSLAYWSNRAENLEKAIAAYQAALTVTTREAFPREWATTQNNLGIAYQDRIHGDRAENLDEARKAFEAALTVRTREELPVEWAETQNNLGIAYRERIRGDRAENLEKATAAYEAALTVFSREALPRDHLRTGRLLGSSLLEAKKWHQAGLAYASARDAFLSLVGKGLNDAEARDLITGIGPMFAEAAFAAAQRGENATALALASEGRARLTAVALRLGRDERPRVIELRSAIRIAERTAQAAHGSERATAVERLVGLRQELLGLVKDAAAESEPGAALARAQAFVATGGAVVVPIITKFGGKILIVASRLGPSATSSSPNKVIAGGGSSLTVLDLPELTTERLDLLLRGDRKENRTGGWLGAYNINYLQGIELNRRWPEWLAAVGGLGPELWRMFGARLDTALNQSGVKRGARLAWLPTGALGILPLGLAQDPVTKQRLTDGYEIVYAQSLEALAAAQQQIANPTAASLAVVINPTEDLPGTEKEGWLVASHFPADKRTVLERKDATPDAVLAALKGKSHWHFASHGTFAWQDARQSALVMHGMAPLSVGRLLETDGLGRPRLVVLSACETGLYDINRSPDEFIGLPGTFTALGAAGVLGTLWPVSDAATALLMARFYDLHMGHRIAPPTALSRAQAWLRESTNTDLLAYSRVAAKQGRLDSRQITEIEQDLSEEVLTQSRNSSLIEWIAQPANRATDVSKSKRKGAVRLARPYAHPYYWAGFIYTGL